MFWAKSWGIWAGVVRDLFARRAVTRADVARALSKGHLPLSNPGPSPHVPSPPSPAWSGPSLSGLSCSCSGQKHWVFGSISFSLTDRLTDHLTDRLTERLSERLTERLSVEGAAGKEAEELINPLCVLVQIARRLGLLDDSYTVILRALAICFSLREAL